MMGSKVRILLDSPFDWNLQVRFLMTFLTTVLFLGALEALLSVDNAVVLALLAKDLPPEQQKKALRYGLAGAVILRLAAVALATHLIKYEWVKIVGGAYLLYLALKHFIMGDSHNIKILQKKKPKFWHVVAKIEFTDLVFAVDSILAAVAVTSDYWTIVAGGLLGVVVIRFAAQYVIGLLQRFPRLEVFAYLLVGGVGAKVIIQAAMH